MAARPHPRAEPAATHREVLGPWFVENCFRSLESRNVPPEARVVSSLQAGDSEGLIGLYSQAAAF